MTLHSQRPIEMNTSYKTCNPYFGYKDGAGINLDAAGIDGMPLRPQALSRDNGVEPRCRYRREPIATKFAIQAC